jgi:hypothetical protein
VETVSCSVCGTDVFYTPAGLVLARFLVSSSTNASVCTRSRLWLYQGLLPRFVVFPLGIGLCAGFERSTDCRPIALLVSCFAIVYPESPAHVCKRSRTWTMFAAIPRVQSYIRDGMRSQRVDEELPSTTPEDRCESCRTGASADTLRIGCTAIPVRELLSHGNGCAEEAQNAVQCQPDRHRSALKSSAITDRPPNEVTPVEDDEEDSNEADAVVIGATLKHWANMRRDEQSWAVCFSNKPAKAAEKRPVADKNRFKYAPFAGTLIPPL